MLSLRRQWGLYQIAKPQFERSIHRSERQIEATEREDFRSVKRNALTATVGNAAGTALLGLVS